MADETLGLKDYLAGLAHSHRARGSRVFSFQQEARSLRNLILELQAVHAVTGETEPRREDLADTLEALNRCWLEHQTLSDLQRCHLRRSPWVLFWPTCVVSQDREFVRAYAQAVESRGRVRMVARLAHVWLRDYPQEHPLFTSWRMAIENIVRASRGNSSPRMQACLTRMEESQCFNPNGPTDLADIVVNSPEPQLVLARAGLLDGELSHGRYLASVHREVLAKLQSQLEENALGAAGLETMFQACVFENEVPRFPEQSHLVANALLLPFSGRVTVDAALQKMILEKLVSILGDPRLHQGNWRQVDPEARDTILSWLVGEAIEAFLRVLDETAVDRHWRSRRKFWSTYFEKGYIQEAWVAFGPEAWWMAERSDHIRRGRYARLSHCDAKHSVLLMRIGKVTIAEWSHSGCCWIWAPGDDTAPQLYQGHYFKDDLTGPPDNGIRSQAGADRQRRNPISPAGFWHIAPETLRWQRRVRDEIHHLTGIMVDNRSLILGK